MLLVPKHDGEYAKVGTVAEVDRHGPAARRRPRRRAERPPPRRSRAPPRPTLAGRLFVEVEERPDEEPPRVQITRARDASTAPSSRRSSSCAATTAASPPSSARSRRPARSPTRPATRPTSPSSRRCSCSRRSTWAERLDLVTQPAARAPDADADPAPHPRRRQTPGWSSSSASTSCASSSTRSARSSARTRRPSSRSSALKIAESATPDHVREQAERELARFERMGEKLARSADDPELRRLAARRAVGCSVGGTARPEAETAMSSMPTTPGSRT